jgi:hypothetical protein
LFLWAHDFREGVLSFLLSHFPGFLKLFVSLFEYFQASAIELVGRDAQPIALRGLTAL